MISEEGRGGGALYRINNIAVETKEQIETIIVMPSAQNGVAAAIMESGLELRTLNLRPLTKSTIGLIKYIFFFPAEIWQLHRLIDNEQPDLIHVNGSWQIKGIIISWLKGKNCIWHMNDTKQNRLIRRVFKMMSRVPKAYIFASKRTHKYYSQIISKRKYISKIIPAPVDTSRIKLIRRRFNKENLKLVTVGYLNKNKGLDLILETANILKEEHVEFYIIGPIIESQQLFMRQIFKKMNAMNLKNVHFLGPKKITSEELKNFDLYFCSSTNEASPTSVWEAMSSGLPVISTDVGDVKEVIESYNCGRVLSQQSGEEASREILPFMEMSQENYMTLSLNSRRAAQERFDRKSIAKAYLRLYSEVVSEGQN